MEDGEPAQEVVFPERPGTDSRFFRAFAFKPTREGDNWTLSIRAYADAVSMDLIAFTHCPGVVVTP